MRKTNGKKFKFAHFSGVNKQRIDFENKQYGLTLLLERNTLKKIRYNFLWKHRLLHVVNQYLVKLTNKRQEAKRHLEKNC